MAPRMTVKTIYKLSDIYERYYPTGRVFSDGFKNNDPSANFGATTGITLCAEQENNAVFMYSFMKLLP